MQATRAVFPCQVLAAAMLAASGPAAGWPQSAVELSALDGNNGFALNGIATDDQSGRSVSSAGDVNGDGIGDLIIGAPNADANGIFNTGQSYVVYGSSTGFSASLDLSALDGSNGFTLNGWAYDGLSGVSVSGAGDVNGDGIDDIIVGARYADANGNNNAGQSYVVYGNSAGFGASLDLSALNGSNGFVLNGIAAEDNTGISVSQAGDVNGDGIDDLIIGAVLADPNGDRSGQSYVVYGNSAGFGASLDLSALDGNIGFALNGIAAYYGSGWSVSGAGDVNGDGIDDIIVGARGADLNGKHNTGQSYVVYGSSASFGASLELSALDGSNGFALNGIAARNLSGHSVSGVGDVNDDGFDDLVVGAPLADSKGIADAGQSYVVYGSSTGFGASLELSALDGSNGFAVDGVAAGDGSGFSVSGAGDVDGDGFDDLIIGAPFADPNGLSLTGQSYIVYGTSAGFGTTLDLSALDGNNGFALNGVTMGDWSGSSVSSAGDVNGDGIDDLIIGAPNADANGIFNTGQSYVVFGQAASSAAPIPTSAALLGTGLGLLILLHQRRRKASPAPPPEVGVPRP